MESTFNPFSLRGKTILVTGASSGIGRGKAVSCSKMGACVVLSGRNENRLSETLAMMAGDGHSTMTGDLTDQQHLADWASSLPELDGVVHCAGIGQRILCRQLREEDVKSVMSVNSMAPVLLQAELLKQRKRKKGASIVFIASIAASLPSA